MPLRAAQAQDIDLAQGGADPFWHGMAAGANAGRWLDQGPLSSGDNRKDLVIGAPGDAATAGKVYIVFAGPVFTGNLNLSSANVTISGPGAGDQFGVATAVGPILVNRTSMTSNLVVGAPGALSGRGAVYVFATPMNDGTLTAANAVYTIVGAPGDHLGAALATADINNDGYREIVMGAPGNNRVYVVAGGSALSGTRDLGVTGGDLLINGAGIGGVLTAGDLTGDGIYEIVIGSPSQNAVYMLTGGYPAVSNLPADADVVFTGIDPGDAAGATLRLADVDADGRTDLIIGAPGGDGPGNSRANAGEAYIVWGRPSFTSMSLANADVTFYGAGTGYFLGEHVSAGDINRDKPNDLVFLADGAGSAGELDVYYGRDRSQIGTALADGRRVVDFASAGPSRRIFGNPSSGRLSTSAVYEVTGEGARDIITGVPTDNSNHGVVVFTISPILIASPATIAVSVEQGAQTNRGVVLENPSPVPIGWSVSADQPWLAPWPISGSSLSGSYGSFTTYISAAGMSPGTYMGTLTFTSTSVHLEMSKTVAITMTVTAPATPPPPPPSTTAEAGKSDFDGDGHMDLVLRNYATGDMQLWAMNGLTRLSSQPMTPGPIETFWHIVGTGDFNGDGRPDLVWQDYNKGYLAVWYMNGAARIGYATFSTPQVSDMGWKIEGVADLNGDGHPDLLWREQTHGWVAGWLLNGTTITSTVSLGTGTVDTDWEIVGGADFDGDGKDDILWKSKTVGYVAVWLMSGGTRMNVVSFPQVDNPNARIAAIGDLNGDGKVDIVWQYPDGHLVVWYMNGLTRSSVQTLSISIADLNWRMSGPR